MSMKDNAMAFFDLCERGKGWEACEPYCHAEASFASQAEPLVDVKTLRDYTDWMKTIVTILPDARYDLKAFATDNERNIVSAFATIIGTHTGEGGPIPPTHQTVKSDYVYVMEFKDDKICHMTKIWNAHWARTQLGWL